MAVTLEAESNKAERGRSPAADAFREFRRHKIAVAGMFFIIFEVLIALFAPLLTPYGFREQNVSSSYARPLTGYTIVETRLDECHWKGTPIEWGCTLYLAGSDSLGRDLWSRVVYGSRVSLSVAIVAAMVSLVIGVLSSSKISTEMNSHSPRDSRSAAIRPSASRAPSRAASGVWNWRVPSTSSTSVSTMAVK